MEKKPLGVRLASAFAFHSCVCVHKCDFIYKNSILNRIFLQQIPEWALDFWHPSEKAMYPDYFAKREQWKKLQRESWEREVSACSLLGKVSLANKYPVWHRCVLGKNTECLLQSQLDSAVLEPLSVWNNLKCLHITASEGEFEVKAEPGAMCQLARAVTAVLWKKINPKWDERRPTAREFLFCCCGALTLPSYTFASDLL